VRRHGPADHVPARATVTVAVQCGIIIGAVVGGLALGCACCCLVSALAARWPRVLRRLRNMVRTPPDRRALPGRAEHAAGHSHPVVYQPPGDRKVGCDECDARLDDVGCFRCARGCEYHVCRHCLGVDYPPINQPPMLEMVVVAAGAPGASQNSATKSQS